MFALSLAMSIFLSLSGLFDEILLRRVGLPSAGPWRNRSYDMWSLGILLLELVLGTRDTDAEMVLEGLLLCAVILVSFEMPGKMGGSLHNLIQVTVAKLRWVINVTMLRSLFPIRKGPVLIFSARRICYHVDDRRWLKEEFQCLGWTRKLHFRCGPIGWNGRTDYLWGLERVMFRKSVMAQGVTPHGVIQLESLQGFPENIPQPDASVNIVNIDL